MGAKQILQLLKELLEKNTINIQQYRTYKGQVLSGQLGACLKGMKRKKLITVEMENEMRLAEALSYTD